MKKILTIGFILALSCLFIMPANAQIKYGVQGGLNLANNSASDLVTNGIKNTVNAKNMTGFYIGPTLEFTVPLIGIGMDASLLYSMKGGKYEYEGENVSAMVKDKLHYLEIPVNFKYKLSFLVAGVYFTAGPYLSYAFAGSRSVSDIQGMIDKDDFNTKSFYEKMDYGINVGLGAELLNHLQLGLKYSWGLNDTAKKNLLNEDAWGTISNFKLKNRIFSVNAAYFF